MITVELYGKQNCCLCDDAKDMLRRVQAEVPFALREIDIEGDPELMAEYSEQVPVVFVGGCKAFKFRIEEAELRRKLARGAR